MKIPICLSLLFAVLGSVVSAQTLIDATFTNEVEVEGTSPDVLDPAFSENVFFRRGADRDDPENPRPEWFNLYNNNELALGTDQGVSLPFASDPDFTVPDTVTLSIKFNLGTLTDSERAYRGIGLGFYSTEAGGGTTSVAAFNGLAISDAGEVRVVVGGDLTIIAKAELADFDVAADHTLSYDVDTTTGAISNVMVDGIPVTISPVEGFPWDNNALTGANLTHVGVFGSASAVGEVGYVDDFTVSTGDGSTNLINATFTNEARVEGTSPDVLDPAFSENVFARRGADGTGPDGPGPQWFNRFDLNFIALGTDQGVSLPFASDPDFTVPDTVTLSMNFNLGTLTDSGRAYRGIGLGFYSTDAGGGTTSTAAFNGLAVSDAGEVRVVLNGDLTIIAKAELADFDVAADHTLSYDVDTTTGAISNVVVDGTQVTISPVEGFPWDNNALTGANLTHVGVFASASAVGEVGFVDNFTVSAVESVGDTWAGYQIQDGVYVDTGEFVGWIALSGDWIWVYDLNRYIYLPESHVNDGGAWAHVPK